jgi:cell wall-associated NlpC family hydrolase
MKDKSPEDPDMIAAIDRPRMIPRTAGATHRFAVLHRSCPPVAIFVLLLSLAIPGRAQRSVPSADFVVCKPVIEMYRNPTAESDVVSQAIYGTDVLSLKKQGDWYDIRTADGYTGWVQASDLLALDAEPYAADGKGVRVAELSANIYRDSDVTLHAPLLRLPWEARLETLPETASSSSRWIQVRLVDGRTGWVQRGDVSADSAPLNIKETLLLARRFLGTTYTWGGVSSFGFDCSGFTQMLVRQRGIEMPRDASLQAAWSGVVPVKREDLQPGDLLFFGSSTAKITHTGMYIGDGEFIHDATHDHPGVQISRLDDAPWTQLLVAARRVK